ncbi:class I SAM-dependent methyltransferase [Amycolatopsis nigrescens]|uniref:class I SAM-dependent methyltransferase n=1 Tax=Amycolatopsis nigrescens TaxID=381445 RepID=UPI00036A05BE|nr:class I SAM-dependent methyltransferase [Amycolatopsis nigrescens]
MNPEYAAGVFSAAHQEFAGWYARLWRPLGELVVAVGRPELGERVLDACCGSGASAVPAALAVGTDGRVDGVDVAGGLLTQGRRDAAALGLEQLVFTEADVLSWQAEPYDLVQCAYGIFFFPDAAAGTRKLIGSLRPGGRLVVSTWAGEAMAGLVPIARAAVAPERPNLGDGTGPDPSRQMRTPEALRDWLSAAGLHDIEVHEIQYVQPLHPDDAWSFFLGAALRGFVEGLGPAALERVRIRFLNGLAEAGISTLDAGSLIAVGHR